MSSRHSNVPRSRDLERPRQHIRSRSRDRSDRRPPDRERVRQPERHSPPRRSSPPHRRSSPSHHSSLPRRSSPSRRSPPRQIRDTHQRDAVLAQPRRQSNEDERRKHGDRGRASPPPPAHRATHHGAKDVRDDRRRSPRGSLEKRRRSPSPAARMPTRSDNDRHRSQNRHPTPEQRRTAALHHHEGRRSRSRSPRSPRQRSPTRSPSTKKDIDRTFNADNMLNFVHKKSKPASEPIFNREEIVNYKPIKETEPSERTIIRLLPTEPEFASVSTSSSRKRSKPSSYRPDKDFTVRARAHKTSEVKSAKHSSDKLLSERWNDSSEESPNRDAGARRSAERAEDPPRDYVYKGRYKLSRVPIHARLGRGAPRPGRGPPRQPGPQDLRHNLERRVEEPFQPSLHSPPHFLGGRDMGRRELIRGRSVDREEMMMIMDARMEGGPRFNNLDLLPPHMMARRSPSPPDFSKRPDKFMNWEMDPLELPSGRFFQHDDRERMELGLPFARGRGGRGGRGIIRRDRGGMDHPPRGGFRDNMEFGDRGRRGGGRMGMDRSPRFRGRGRGREMEALPQRGSWRDSRPQRNTRRVEPDPRRHGATSGISKPQWKHDMYDVANKEDKESTGNQRPTDTKSKGDSAREDRGPPRRTSSGAAAEGGGRRGNGSRHRKSKNEQDFAVTTTTSAGAGGD